MSAVLRPCLWLLWAITLPLSAQTVEYIHTDALGSPVAITDANRNVVERSEYEPYGALLNRPLSDGPGYTGHVSDAATGLSYMQQRYYDPGIGRFLSVDPVTANGTTGSNFNRYWYANNNPYKFTDPDGRESACISNGGDCGMGPGTGQKIMEVAPIIADFTPIIGDIKGIAEAVQDPSVSNIAAASVALIPVVGDAGGKLIKNADKVADPVKVLPKPPTGKGSVPPSERDPKRAFTRKQTGEMLDKQGGKCASCAQPKELKEVDGHHVQRHADGGPTTLNNGAAVCHECHQKLHQNE